MNSITGESPAQEREDCGSVTEAIAVVLLVLAVIAIFVWAAHTDTPPNRGHVTTEQPAPCDNDCRWVSDE
jgi:hypothetical protein